MNALQYTEQIYVKSALTRSGKEAIEDRMCDQRFRAPTTNQNGQQKLGCCNSELYQHCTHRKQGQVQPSSDRYHYVPNTIQV